MNRKKRQLPKPTGAEWEILQVLWDLGPSTVRQVHEVLQKKNPSQYTTTLKLMQIMAAKGLVLRDGSQRAHSYRAAVAREESQGRMLDDLLDRVFGGSAADLVMRAISRRKTSREELTEIRRIIQEVEGERK